MRDSRVDLFRPAWLAFLILVAVLVVSCATTQVPIPIQTFMGPQSDGKTLVIPLRGIGGSAQDFDMYGFIAELQSAYPSYDVKVPDAHFGYYRERTLLSRLQQDVLTAAKTQGYEHIWLVGVSLGGLGSLMALKEWPNDFAGVVLISPYSGKQDLHAALELWLQQGGPSPLDDERYDPDFRRLWQWILKDGGSLKNRNVWLGFGDKDHLSGHELLATQIAPDHVIRVEGKHRAKVFSMLLSEAIARNAFTVQTQP